MKYILLTLTVMLIISIIFYGIKFIYPIEGIVTPLILIKMMKNTRKIRIAHKIH